MGYTGFYFILRRDLPPDSSPEIRRLAVQASSPTFATKLARNSISDEWLVGPPKHVPHGEMLDLLLGADEVHDISC